MKISIKPQKPFNFDLSCMVFADGDPQIRKYDGNKFWQVLNINNKLILVNIQSTGKVDEPELMVELNSENSLSPEDKELIVKIISRMFNMDFDLSVFYRAVKKDNIMYSLSKELFGLKTPTTPTVFEALMDSIVEQQISLKAAHSIERKIIKTFGSALLVGGEHYYAFPTPEQLNNAPADQLRGCGLSFRKVEYIKSISKAIVQGKLDLDKFRDYGNIDEIIEELCQIRGIGKWTAELTVIRGLNGLNSFPADDISIRRVISHYYCQDKKISSDEARKIAKKWDKWKGLAAFYLIIAEMSSIQI